MRKKHDAASKRIVVYWHKLWKIKMTPVKQELHVETRTRINYNSLFSRQRCSGGFVHWICPNSERRFEAIAIFYFLYWPIRGGFARKGIFFRPQVIARVGISPVKVYKGVGKSVWANRWFLWLYKVEKTFYFCD